jgi:phage-related protein
MVAIINTVVPLIVEAIGGLIASAKAKFTETDWGAVGTGIVQGIAAGITAGASFIADAAKNAAQHALDAAKGFLGIQSPSTVAAAEIGLPLAQGIGVGIQQGLSGIDIGAMLRALFGS